MLGHSSAMFGRFEGNAFTRQSELAARAAGGERASVEESMRICFQELTRNQVFLVKVPSSPLNQELIRNRVN